MSAFPVNAQQAQQQAAAHQRIMNAARQVPKLPEQFREFSISQQVWIYNVGPWAHRRELGTAGTFFIPLCPDGRDYVAMDPIPGVPIDLKIDDEHRMGLLLEDGGGRYLAEQVIGIGAHQPKANSLLVKGVFIGAKIGPEARPTKDEVSEAKRRVQMYFEELVNEARRAAEMGPKEMEAVIQDNHHMAAKRLNLDPKVERWMGRSTASARQSCLGCGTPIDGEPIICPVCKFVIDEQRYEKMKGRFAK